MIHATKQIIVLRHQADAARTDPCPAAKCSRTSWPRKFTTRCWINAPPPNTRRSPATPPDCHRTAPQTLRDYQTPPDLAKRLECGVFTAAFAHAMHQRARKSFAHAKAVLKPPYSRRWCDCQAPPGLAKLLECGAFTAAFARAMRQRTEKILRPRDSGAEATALQTLVRLPSVSRPREASGVRRVHRRFRPRDAPTS